MSCGYDLGGVRGRVIDCGVAGRLFVKYSRLPFEKQSSIVLIKHQVVIAMVLYVRSILRRAVKKFVVLWLLRQLLHHVISS